MYNLVKCIVVLGLIYPSLIFSQDYAYLYINKSAASSNWLNVPAGTPAILGSGNVANNFLTGQLGTGWTYTGGSNSITVPTGKGGNYYIHFTINATGQNTGITWEYAIYRGSTKTSISNKRNMENNKDVGNTAANGIIALSAGDVITVKVSHNNAAAQNFEVVKAQLVLAKVAEDPSAVYGEMTINNNTTAQRLSTKDTYYQITGWTGGTSNGISFGTSLLPGTTGKYLAIMGASYSTANNARIVNLGFAKAGTTLNIMSRRYIGSGGVYGNISACGIIDVTNTSSDYITVVGSGSVANTDLTVHDANVTLVKLATTSTPPYASLYMHDNSTYTVLSASTWTHIGGSYSESILNNFTHSSGTLTPTGLSAGIYLVNYANSIQSTYATGAVNQVHAGVFVNGIEQTELSMHRTLSSATSVGSVGGTGIVSITLPEHTVDMRIFNDKSDNILVSQLNFNLMRIAVTGDGSLPVELTSFESKPIDRGILLTWETASEIENLGFILERKVGNESWNEIASYQTNSQLAGQGSITHATQYSYLDHQAPLGTVIYYRLSDVDYSGLRTYHPTIKVLTQLEPTRLLVAKNAYPNPFNPETRIQYVLHSDSDVIVSIHDLLGNRIKTLKDERQLLGSKTVTWDGRNELGQVVSAGVYFYRITAGNELLKGKVLFVK